MLYGKRLEVLESFSSFTIFSLEICTICRVKVYWGARDLKSLNMVRFSRLRS